MPRGPKTRTHSSEGTAPVTPAPDAAQEQAQGDTDNDDGRGFWGTIGDALAWPATALRETTETLFPGEPRIERLPGVQSRHEILNAFTDQTLDPLILAGGTSSAPSAARRFARSGGQARRLARSGATQAAAVEVIPPGSLPSSVPRTVPPAVRRPNPAAAAARAIDDTPYTRQALTGSALPPRPNPAAAAARGAPRSPNPAAAARAIDDTPYTRQALTGSALPPRPNPAAAAARGVRSADDMADIAAAGARTADDVAGEAARRGLLRGAVSFPRRHPYLTGLGALGVAGVGLANLLAGDEAEALPPAAAPLDLPDSLFTAAPTGADSGTGIGGVGASAAADLIRQQTADAITARQERMDLLLGDAATRYGDRFLAESAARALETQETVAALRGELAAPDRATHGGALIQAVRGADNAQVAAVDARARLSEAGMTADRYWADELARSSPARLLAAQALADQRDRQAEQDRLFELQLRAQDRADRAADSPYARLRQEADFNNSLYEHGVAQFVPEFRQIHGDAVAAGVPPAKLQQWLEGEFANVPYELGMFGSRASAEGASAVLDNLNTTITAYQTSDAPLTDAQEQDLAELLAVRPFVQRAVTANYRAGQTAEHSALARLGA